MIKTMRKFIRGYKNNNSGTTAVEFALVGMPFMLAIFGIMEAGRLVWSMNGIQYAVEETSRYAAINPDLGTDAFQDYAEDKLSEMFISTASLQVTTSRVTSNGIDFMQVDGDYTHSTMLNGLLPGDFGIVDFDTSARKPVIN